MSLYLPIVIICFDFSLVGCNEQRCAIEPGHRQQCRDNFTEPLGNNGCGSGGTNCKKCSKPSCLGNSQCSAVYGEVTGRVGPIWRIVVGIGIRLSRLRHQRIHTQELGRRRVVVAPN